MYRTKTRMHRFIGLAICAVALAGVGCDDSSPTAPSPPDPTPAWVNALIAQIASEPVTDPPSSLYSYRYRNDTVYFRPQRCCDVMSDLYDDDGTLICHPDGGFGGNGDGRCPDFLATRSDERLIWRDPRT
jgi:hypothetical protein